MKFTEEKANQIIKKYCLSEKTFRVWKTRKSIPDKYSDENFKIRKTSKAADIKHNRLMELLESGTINQKILAEIAQVANYKITDAKNGNIRLSDDDMQKCINEIKRAKIEVVKTFVKYSPLLLKRLFNHPLIVYTKIIKDRTIFEKVSYIRRGLGEPDELLWNQVKDKYIIFAMTLNI